MRPPACGHCVRKITQKRQDARLHRAVDQAVHADVGDAQHLLFAVYHDEERVVAETLKALGRALAADDGHLLRGHHARTESVDEGVDFHLKVARLPNAHGKGRRRLKQFEDAVLPKGVRTATSQPLADALSLFGPPVGNPREGPAFGGILADTAKDAALFDHFPFGSTLARTLHDEARPRTVEAEVLQNLRKDVARQEKGAVDDEGVGEGFAQNRHRAVIVPAGVVRIEERPQTHAPRHLVEGLVPVAGHDRDVADARLAEVVDGALQKRHAAHGKKRLRELLRKGLEP